ncbi:TetR/AcrR family transcriptional regulator [Mycobacterium sp.]|uniref:TetR/AcrR family transcriptional regulator n=1 Tax=Mycobacterium sp. TaxID=1785 RepID=UPI002BB677CD|nr:TetR/AcrR family transcriptional regulator [Mycobacterium sp.]HME48211.1 TetR/AcrR family transcriptional regulator [Mycobacterium sp.]
MGTRQAAAARTRMSLIDAGLRLAERTGLSGLSINLLVEEAGVSKGTFFHHFGDRASYVLALHREFHDRLLTEIEEATEGLRPGRERLAVAANTYLDGCLRNRGVRALLLEARADRVIADEIGARNASTAKVLRADFTAMKWPHPLESAQLWVGMTAEAALLELTAGRRSPAVRAALKNFTYKGAER